MPNRSIPLSRHQCLVAGSVAELATEVEAKIGACLVSPPVARERVDVRANQYPLPAGSALWSSGTTAPLTVRFPDHDYIRVQVQLQGTGSTGIGRHEYAVDDLNACISPAHATLVHRCGFQQLFWRVPSSTILRKLSALTGRPVAQSLTFEPVLPRSSSRYVALVSILNSILTHIEQCEGQPAAPVITELEQAMITSLLFNCPHSLRQQLERPDLRAAPRQVRLVEEYIEQHWDQALDIEKMAELTGCSVRSIYRAFRRSRGYSPKEFANRLRLIKARQLLQDPAAGQSVTEVAFACGFSELSHFSREFSKTFGETPSAVLRAAR